MLKILALQMLKDTGRESLAMEDSGQSVTCGGCSCASNVCTSGATQVGEIPTFE